MKNKRNQIIITALAIMIAIAGYINYTGSLSDIISIKDKDSVTASNEVDDKYVSGETLDITSTDEDFDVPGDGGTWYRNTYIGTDFKCKIKQRADKGKKQRRFNGDC